jgi:signal transduction histidine kinase
LGWLAGVLVAAGGVFAFAGALFALAWRRRRKAVEHGVACGMAVAMALSMAATFGNDVRLARGALIFALAATAHYAIRTKRIERERRALIIAYGFALALSALNVLAWFPTPVLEVMIYGYGIAATFAIVSELTRAYVAGQAQTASLVFGATTLLVTLFADAASAVGVLRGLSLVPVGFVALIFGLTARLAAEYGYVWRQLDAHQQDLANRTRELRDSHRELRAAQQALVNKEQLAVVGELAAVVAHEVRNPLAVIGNAVSGLRKSNLAREDQTTLLEILDSEATRLNRIVTDLLRFARPVTVQGSKVLLAELVDRALGLANKRPDLEVEFKVDVPNVEIWGDSNLLRQVFDNLIENAVQAMDGRGTLAVRIRRASDDPVERIAVDIIDTGEGMDTEVRSRAKDPFFTTRPSGTGLGLAIVDRIVDAHGGRFLIKSRAGEGTTVTVLLPQRRTTEPPTNGEPTRSEAEEARVS